MTIPLTMLPTDASPLVSLRNLQVVRGNQTILRGVTADILRGQITALIGLNGSGKSTLLRTLLREFPHTGEIHFRCGHDHSRPRPEYLGYVPQRLSIDPRLPLTVRDLMGLSLKRGPLFFGLSKALTAKITAVLTQVGVGHLLDTPVEGLSGGQLQRVLLALALEPQPELLLLDEPASGIDFKDELDFYRMIAHIVRDTGVTVLLVSHDLATVQEFAQQVLCLNGGRIQAVGAPQEILTPENIRRLFGPQRMVLGR